MIRKVLIALSCLGLIAPALAFAQVSTSTSAAVTTLPTTLHFGDKGELVKILQQLLASDSSVFPEGTITGTFGPLTQTAVKRFQKKHDLPPVGSVGPKTLRTINSLFSENDSENASGTPHMWNMATSTGSTTPHEGGDRRHFCIPPGLVNNPSAMHHEYVLPPLPLCKRGMGGGSEHRFDSSTTSTTSPLSNSDQDDHKGDPFRNGASTTLGGQHIIQCSVIVSGTTTTIAWPASIPCPTTFPPRPPRDDHDGHGQQVGDH